MSENKKSSPFKSKQFTSLKDEWYAKLKSDGFKDIEASGAALNQGENYIKRLKFGKAQESCRRYYEIAFEFLHKDEFESEKDRVVWEFFCEGDSMREIALKLKTHKKDIFLRIKKYKKMAGL